jgi:hypothetical protein
MIRYSNNENLIQFTFMLSENKCVNKTIMASKPNQLQVTTNITQANAIIEKIYQIVISQSYAQII